MRPVRSSRHLPALAVALLVGVALPQTVAAWEVSPDATPQEFSAFHRRFAGAAYGYPGHGAAPLGLVGFEVYAEATVDRGFDEEPFFDGAVDGDLPGGWLTLGRVGVRKGLPGGIDLGASYTTALDGDVKLVSADVEWAVIDGGLLSPALGVRLSGTRTLDSGAYELSQYGAEAILSKGFTVVTPYVGGGLVHSKGTLDVTPTSDGPTRFDESETSLVAFAGVTVNLLLPKITVEVEKADTVTASLKVGFGF